jgi:hypothetical protein
MYNPHCWLFHFHILRKGRKKKQKKENKRERSTNSLTGKESDEVILLLVCWLEKTRTCYARVPLGKPAQGLPCSTFLLPAF